MSATAGARPTEWGNYTSWYSSGTVDTRASGKADLKKCSLLPLAKKLGVTRGCFYWHVRDHEDLVFSFLDRWRDRRLHDLQYGGPKGGDFETELRQILELLLTDASRNIRRLQV